MDKTRNGNNAKREGLTVMGKMRTSSIAYRHRGRFP